MNSVKRFYHLHSPAECLCGLSHEARQEAIVNWMCPKCFAPKPSLKPLDFQIIESISNESPLNGLMSPLVGIARRDFLEHILESGSKSDLILGKITAPNGKIISDWCSFRGRHKIIVRGTEQAGARKCEVCQYVHYSAVGQSFLSPEPPCDANVYASGMAGLVVSQSVFSRLELDRWKQIYIDELQIVDPPPDGLGDLDAIKPGDRVGHFMPIRKSRHTHPELFIRPKNPP